MGLNPRLPPLLLLQLHYSCEILFYRDRLAALVQSGDCNNLHSAFQPCPASFHPPFTISSSLTAPPSSTPLLSSPLLVTIDDFLSRAGAVANSTPHTAHIQTASADTTIPITPTYHDGLEVAPHAFPQRQPDLCLLSLHRLPKFSSTLQIVFTLLKVSLHPAPHPTSANFSPALPTIPTICSLPYSRPWSQVRVTLQILRQSPPRPTAPISTRPASNPKS